MSTLSRRALIGSGVVAAAGVVGSGLLSVGRAFGLIPPDSGGFYGPGETLSYAAHRLLGRNALAREFPRAMISAKPFANELSPFSENFKAHEAANFAAWRLDVSGLVRSPATLSLAELRAMGKESQITEVNCEEGWNYIAEWAGTPLSAVLNSVGVKPEAKYVVYLSEDTNWWDSIDLDEAMHPQTVLAWEMNGSALPVPFGGPLRIRVPRQLAYKSVKFIDRLVVTDSLRGFGKGKGSASADAGYAWYAGA
ncbi:molybdopterin-dependent oxidoreductase [Gemmatimonas sp.]|uniref:molybdopterin-dependent oxidoreductase n=1 Tax=Gemmatimonas sp. TaxID=1962908 RepID=UPI003983C53B